MRGWVMRVEATGMGEGVHVRVWRVVSPASSPVHPRRRPSSVPSWSRGALHSRSRCHPTPESCEGAGTGLELGLGLGLGLGLVIPQRSLVRVQELAWTVEVAVEDAAPSVCIHTYIHSYTHTWTVEVAVEDTAQPPLPPLSQGVRLIEHELRHREQPLGDRPRIRDQRALGERVRACGVA